MPDLRLSAPPPRAELLRQLRTRLSEALPGVRVVAQEILGADTPIDFVGIEPDGRLILVLVGEAGEDLELVARGLAQRAWVTRRLGDWLQLAPDLGLRPEAGVRLLLLCTSFRPESEAAARALAQDAPELAIYHCVRNGVGVEALLERLSGPAAVARPEPAAAAPPQAPFRTGLSDADLGLSAEERGEFD